MTSLLLLKQAWAHRALILAVAVVGLLALAKRQNEAIVTMRAQAAMKPIVQASRHVDKDKKITRGPVKTTKTVVTAPDGTKTATTVKDEAPATEETAVHIVEDRKEIPQAIRDPDRRTRYVGAGVDPARPDFVRARTGLTVFGAFDVGMAADVDTVKKQITRPMIEVAYRF